MKQLKLSYIICALLFLVAINSSCQQQKKSNIITADSLNAIIKSNHGILLDVRTPEEFAEGHIPGAINIDFKNEGFGKALDSLDKSKQYIIYCRSGNRSTSSLEEMKQKGFENVYHFKGGILEWEQKGFEEEK